MDGGEPEKHSEVKCNLCGQRIVPPSESDMWLHMMLNHPLDLLLHKKVVGGLGEFFNHLGGAAADKLKEKIGHGKT